MFSKNIKKREIPCCQGKSPMILSWPSVATSAKHFTFCYVSKAECVYLIGSKGNIPKCYYVIRHNRKNERTRKIIPLEKTCNECFLTGIGWSRAHAIESSSKVYFFESAYQLHEWKNWLQLSVHVLCYFTFIYPCKWTSRPINCGPINCVAKAARSMWW